MLKGLPTEDCCVFVVFVVLRGVEARCAGFLPGPPRVMLTYWWWWWWWQAVGKVVVRFVYLELILNEVVKLIVKFVARRPLRGLSARSAPSGGALVLVLVLGMVFSLVW